ncbi:hypothetical protein [Nocardioides piscis]|uniref:Uncharacterized protein n=1 Tax=Nocardioides piscis TaxID=2714938 RepID=A0A6G7YC43_9ACTN|nr:hypothetical protein [Nocardioides piscis]QIK74221.1 hypothetical protein G7071_00965 [Nocardioides piscis]
MFAYTHGSSVALLLAAVEEGPAPEDVKAGWTALIIFLLLAVAVAVLGFSLVKHLRKAEAAKDAGAYGDEPKRPDHDSTT